MTVAGLVLLGALATAPSRADIIRTATSVTFTGAITTASTGLVTVAATLWVDDVNAPGVLNLSLRNTSTATVDPAGLLTAFYFGAYGGTTSGTAPPLTYLSGTGQVYRPLRTGTDVAGVWTPPSVTGSTGTFEERAGLSNLMAIGTGDLTWQFRAGLSLVASEPPLNFGIGTVGGTRLAPNNFNGSLVDGNDFGIYAGDATTQNVQAQGLLVGGTAIFRFGGFTAPAWTIGNVPDHAVFALGSGPDLIITVPEPGSLALVVLGGLAALGARLRRRSASLDGILRSTAMAVVVGIVIVVLLFAVPARAAPLVGGVPVADWNFETGSGGLGWTSLTASSLGPPTAVSGTSWDHWTAPSSKNPHWQVDPKRGAAPPDWFVTMLTSPVITVPQRVDALDVIIRHRFNFPTDIKTGQPIVVGVLAWRFYDPGNLNAIFQPFGPAVFATGPVPPPFDALSPAPNWVPSNYVTGTFAVPPLVPGGGGWAGSSPGWEQRDFVMSQVLLDGGLLAGQQVQFRFVNAVVGLQCNGSEWDVSRVTVIGQVPEPGGLALATVGAGFAAAGLAARSWRTCRSTAPGGGNA